MPEPEEPETTKTFLVKWMLPTPAGILLAFAVSTPALASPGWSPPAERRSTSKLVAPTRLVEFDRRIHKTVIGLVTDVASPRFTRAALDARYRQRNPWLSQSRLSTRGAENGPKRSGAWALEE